ncbi:MAG: aminotransferase class IV [Treponema sp.]|jgi:D-alanine transaminase|nr:aminotransferase class IV [Treponema sp.]
METLGYYNGEIATIDELRIPMNDRVCWFGDGVYDATLAENHAVFALHEHIDRFFNSAALIEIPLSFTKPWLAELLRNLVRKLDSPTQFVYWQVTRGTTDRAHTFPDTGTPANLWIMLRPFVLPDLTKKVKLITVEDIRFLLCNVKTLNLLPNVLASEQAKRAGCYEAVFHRGERVTECSHSNVHILKNGVFRTAPTDNLILPGIARAHLIAHCLKLGIAVSEKPFTVAELMSADEVIVSSSSRFCVSASHIDGQEVGGKAPELLTKLRESLLNEFHEASATGV